MNPFGRLLQAKTETELFILICGSVYPSLGRYQPGDEFKNQITRTTLSRAGSVDEGYALQFEIQQNFSIPNEKGALTFQTAKTHVFTLHQDEMLTWAMLGQPILTGLNDIQATLKRLRKSVEPALLTEIT